MPEKKFLAVGDLDEADALDLLCAIPEDPAVAVEEEVSIFRPPAGAGLLDEALPAAPPPCATKCSVIICERDRFSPRTTDPPVAVLPLPPLVVESDLPRFEGVPLCAGVGLGVVAFAVSRIESPTTTPPLDTKEEEEGAPNSDISDCV
jgi:hypothetical protein